METVSAGAPFLLEDLLGHHELGLELRLGEAEARRRPVSGVHGIEIEEPAQWLAPDWVMLTTGVLLTDEAAQRALPAELAAGGLTALGFGCGLSFDDVPPALHEGAEEAGLPLFAIPLETPFREIVAAVHRALLSSEMRTLQRLSSMQRYLVDALHQREPRSALLRRLATLLDASTGLLRADGRIRLAEGELPDGLGAALGEPVGAVRELVVDGWHVVAAPVPRRDGSGPPRWLVVGDPDERFVNRLTRPVLQAAVPLLAAVERLDDAGRAQDRAVRRALFVDLLDVAPGADDQGLAARARAVGLDLGRDHVVVAVQARPSPDGDDGTPGPEPATALERTLTAVGLPHLLLTEHGRALALTPQPDAAVQARLREALHAEPRLACGTGRVFRGVCGVAESRADAHVVCDLVPRDAARRWRRYEELDLAELAVSQLPDDRLRPKVDAVLAVLDERPGGREALEAWFACELDVSAAARSLHLHPNSLRYRLGRLADALERPLRAPATITALQLALAVERRRGGG